MGIKLITSGIHKDEKRFVFERKDESDKLEDARNYFGDAYTLLTKGLGYKISRKSASSCFSMTKNGRHSSGSLTSISLEDWEKINNYASRYRNRERHDQTIIILEV